MKFYFVRHGKKDDKYRGGWSNLGLICEGIIQAQKLADYLNEKQPAYKINRIISSDLLRAQQTADIIDEKLKLGIEYSADWREINNGVLAGMENSAAKIKYPGMYFDTLEMDEKYPGGESPAMFFDRIKLAFENLCKNSFETENILVVTHNCVINIIYHILSKKEWSNKREPFTVDCAAIHLFEKTNNGFQTTMQNFNDYLK